MQLVHLYQETLKNFILAGIEDAQSDTDQLLGFCLGLTRSQLFLHGTRELSSSQLAHCRELIARRLAREPLQYITGTREFWSLEFSVSPAVLIPRAETEFLLEEVLQTLRQTEYHDGAILDMCTGSGVISVVLAMELGAAALLAVDLSPDALNVAAANIARHKKENEVMLLCSDLFSALRPHSQFECIVANPPYIPEEDLAGLQPEVRQWEPANALAAGREGLDIIRRIAEDAPRYLAPRGWLFLEIGAGQKESVRTIFSGHIRGAFDCIEIVNDWSERPRVLKARRKG